MSNNSNTTTSAPTTTESINIFASLKTKKDTGPIELKEATKIKLSTLDTKSKMIRFLAKEGYKTGQIANILGIRYQHVFNVLHTVAKS